MKMNVLTALLAKEENRNDRMISEYNRELEHLPRGSIKVKKVKDKTYFYVSFRDGDKVISKYVGKNEESVAALREQLIRRKQIEEIIKKLKEEKAQIMKIAAGVKERT